MEATFDVNLIVLLMSFFLCRDILSQSSAVHVTSMINLLMSLWINFAGNQVLTCTERVVIKQVVHGWRYIRCHCYYTRVSSSHMIDIVSKCKEYTKRDKHREAVHIPFISLVAYESISNAKNICDDNVGKRWCKGIAQQKAPRNSSTKLSP